MPPKCEGCKYWSEMIAEAKPSGHVAAMCLNQDSPRYTKMTVLRDGCQEYAEGPPVDLPQTEHA